MAEKYKRKAVFSELNKFCHCSTKKGNFIELTKWHNGEGFDVEIHDNSGQTRFQLTWGEFDALKKLTKKLRK